MGHFPEETLKCGVLEGSCWVPQTKKGCWRVCFFEGVYRCLVVLKRNQKKNHHFAGPLQKRHTHVIFYNQIPLFGTKAGFAGGFIAAEIMDDIF